MIPLPRLSELLPHEEEFLPRMGKHVAEEGSDVREALPFIARHFAQQRPLEVDYLIVRNAQEEVFVEGVQQAERDALLVIRTINGIRFEIAEHVMHPAHVPLEREAQAPDIHGARNTGIGARLFGDGENARHRVRLDIESL